MLARNLNPGSLNPRRGVVLLAVLVVIVLLSLAAYQYSDLMLSEYRASDNYHKAAQAKANADSGIYRAAAVLSDPEFMPGGNVHDNPQLFQNVSVGDEKTKSFVSLIAPNDPDAEGNAATVRYGMIDEGGKININAAMKRDPSGKQLYDMLAKLPNMTDEIANAIIDWLDADSQPRPNGAESDYYSGLSPSYRTKNGPLDSIEELLLVRGVDFGLLFGNDTNRNGVQDPNEPTGETGFDRGWSAYLTIYSREQNLDSEGLVPTFINIDAEPAVLYETLAPKLGDDLTKFIILYRQYGASNSTGQVQTTLGTIQVVLSIKTTKSSSSQNTVPGDLAAFEPDLNKKLTKKVNSLFDLVSAQVTVPSTQPKGPSIVFTSPLADPGARRDLMPLVFNYSSIFAETEIPARINILTAPREVLLTLPELTATDVETILAFRPNLSNGEAVPEIYRTPAWLVTDAGLNPQAVSKWEKYITTRSQVYRVQSVGYFDGKGPTARVEAVIDVNAGRPRILAYRDLTELGRSKVK
ncbi:MAG: general secretion pathway protein GspK [Gemmataceae bacterium]|nr:general secretion pathway protein GspK [Gemmataceae bacterium]